MSMEGTIKKLRKEIESLKAKNEIMEIYVIPIEKDGSEGERKLLLSVKVGDFL